jgi:hypothetical protein
VTRVSDEGIPADLRSSVIDRVAGVMARVSKPGRAAGGSQGLSPARSDMVPLSRQ